MPAAGERRGPAAGERRWTGADERRWQMARTRALRLCGAAAAVAWTSLGLMGCTASAGLPAGSTSPSDQNTPTSSAHVGAPPAADLEAIRTTVDLINATAGGPIEAQQAVLADLADPAAAPRDCPPATTTVRFEPAFHDVTASTVEPIGGPLTGTAYTVPARVRVYVADRRTTTDLTLLYFGVDAGTARMLPICVR